MKRPELDWKRWVRRSASAATIALSRSLLRPLVRLLKATMPRLRRSHGSTAVLAFLLITLSLGAALVLLDRSTRVALYQGPLTEELSRMISPHPPTAGHVREELDCLARNVYFEARGEPHEGKLAVAHVVMNRAASSRYPDTVCEVIRQGGDQKLHKCQFSWWCDGQSDDPTDKTAWSKSEDVARQVYWGVTEDPTEGALWYHATEARPVWRKALQRGPRIGDHIFYVAPGDRPQLAKRTEEAGD